MTDQEYTKEVLNFIHKMITDDYKVAYFRESWVLYGGNYVRTIILTDIIPFVDFYPFMMDINIALSTKKDLFVFTDNAGYTIDEFVEILFPKEK